MHALLFCWLPPALWAATCSKRAVPVCKHLFKWGFVVAWGRLQIPGPLVAFRFIYGFRFFVTLIMGVVTATLFIRTEFSADSVESGNLYFGAPPPPPSPVASNC